MKIKTVYIEITNRCNFNCATCYNRSGLNRETKELSIEKIRTIMDRMRSFGADRFLFSGGEPTLHSEFDAILDIIDENPDLSFGIVTNGSIKNERLIEMLNERENFTLQVSLDGSCEEENAKTRGAGRFAQAVEFAKAINKSKQRARLKMVISKQNTHDVEAFYHLAVSLGFTPEFAFIYRSGNGNDEWTEKSVPAMKKSNILRLIDRLNREHGIEAYLPKCTSRCPFSGSEEPISVCIKVNGDMQPCQGLYDSRFSLGNVLISSDEEFAKRMEEIRRIARQRSVSDYECKNCIIRNCCGRGCMAEAFNLTGDPLGYDDNCALRKMEFINFNLKSHIEATK